ncbi:MAG: GNAT family N-acetyltransferase [Chloroflexi bacterium]|nr:GNAT family N-acetyltransferase [Chloroflexota bacterium]
MVAGRFRSRAWRSRDDTRLMQALARTRLEVDWPAIRFHPGDLDWWVVQAHGRVPGVAGGVRLWFGPGHELAAFGWFSPPADLDFLVGSIESGATATLVGEMIAWADRCRSAGADASTEPLRAWVAVGDEPGMGALRALGLVVEARPGFVQFTGELSLTDRWPPPRLAPGLALRILASDADIEARVACGRAAFPGSTMTPERYRTVRESWLYRDDLDLQIVAADGAVVAFALGWFDEASGVVELEPVGVRPDWHRRGLGGEICRAVLRVARGLGAERATIAAERRNDAALGLYANLGLSITAEIISVARPR